MQRPLLIYFPFTQSCLTWAPGLTMKDEIPQLFIAGTFNNIYNRIRCCYCRPVDVNVPRMPKSAPQFLIAASYITSWSIRSHAVAVIKSRNVSARIKARIVYAEKRLTPFYLHH